MILDDLISNLNFDVSVRDIRMGVFHTSVLTQNCGLAATLPRDALRQQPPMVRAPGLLLDKNPLELAQLVLQCVSQGANFRQIRGVKRLTMLK